MSKKVLLETRGACVELLDCGVAWLRFTSEGNRVTPAAAAWAAAALHQQQEGVKAVVVACCAGYDNDEIRTLARSGDWKGLEEASTGFQSLTAAMRGLSVPVVAALRGTITDLGVELAMGADAVCAAEAVVSLGGKDTPFTPTAGGLATLALGTYAIGQNVPGCDIVPFLKRAFQLFVTGKPCQSLGEAAQRGIPLPWSTDCAPEELEARATAQALFLAGQGFVRSAEERTAAVSGTTGAAALEITAVNLHRGGFLSQDRYLLAGDAARVLSGGDVPKGTTLTETRLRALERAAFLTSCRRLAEKEETA
ncbi:hypothetical protein SDC9_91435 [bioreactor metagenome]|uniref:3-hydroxyacyl-CoA dehydrogenase n=1 Tax=bioreactor metagenome TaxID=1076179 RepID=A0A645A4P8_9ZZZZ